MSVADCPSQIVVEFTVTTATGMTVTVPLVVAADGQAGRV